MFRRAKVVQGEISAKGVRHICPGEPVRHAPPCSPPSAVPFRNAFHLLTLTPENLSLPMKHTLYALAALLSLPVTRAAAQQHSSVHNELRLPVSAHTAALGGENISLIEDTPTAGWTNPALYANVSDLSVGLDFMTYTAGSTWMGAQFVKAAGERHTFAANARYMNYGSMDETDAQGNVTGTFGAKDIIIGGAYSYLLSDRWTGGAAAKFVFSNIASYSAVAFSIDLGLNYYDEDNDLSLSAAVQNLGVQLKPYADRPRAHLPFVMDLGMTKGVAHLPVRVSLTLTDLTRWSGSYYFYPDAVTEGKDGKVGFFRKAINHFVVGLDVLPTQNVYLSLGYNFRRAYELKAAGSSHWAGISAGAGVSTRRVKFGVSYAKYHQAGNSFMVNAAYSIR